MSKILIVEDINESAEMAAQILSTYGHETEVAATGELGLELARTYLPDLIIYDYMLPDIEARVFLDRLRSEKELEHTPIVVCSATPQRLIYKAVGEPGFTDWIGKPYRLSDFMRVVERCLKAGQS